MSTASPEESVQPIPPSELPLEDLRATEPVPESVKHALSRRPLDVFIGDRRATPAELCAALQDTDELELPDGFSTHLAAAPDIINIADIDSSEQISTDALPGYRPPWVDQVYHPRSLPPREMPYLRAANGTLVEPHARIGREDRKQISPQFLHYPWHCIGTVNVHYTDLSSGRRWVNSGTATLVGRRTILTAAHIMPSRSLFNPNPPRVWSATFEAGKSEDFVPLAPIAHVTRAAGYWGQAVSSTDMMVMQLDTPLGDHLGFLPVRAYDDSWEDEPMWSHVGYPDSLGSGRVPFQQVEIRVYDDEVGYYESEELYTYADSTDGDSGGPLFGWIVTSASVAGLEWKFTYAPTIIGVRSGGNRERTVDAGGNALTRLCNWGRTNFD